MASDLAAAAAPALQPEPVQRSDTTLVDPEPFVVVTRARTRSDMQAAALLVESLYVSRGYLAPRPDVSPESDLVFIAAENGAATGTLTLRRDGPAGLRADECFGDELDAVRAQGRRACELSRLAIAPIARSTLVIRALFEHVYEILRESGEITDVFIEVNPRHTAFYRRVFGFDVAAGERMCPRVLAPAVLMRLDFTAFEARLRDSGGAFMHDRDGERVRSRMA
jgi:GNAT superfamily N-acetyltransferase